MTDVHAAIGLAQLKKVEVFNKRRREIARRYDQAFAGLQSMRPPKVSMGKVHVYHQYTLVCDDRSILMDHLRTHDVGAGVYYPRPIHAYPHLDRYGHSSLENAEWLADHVVSIPVHPALSDDEVDTVIQRVVEADEVAVKASQKV